MEFMNVKLPLFLKKKRTKIAIDFCPLNDGKTKVPDYGQSRVLETTSHL